jgi:serine/threonine-protein kinase RsbT
VEAVVPADKEETLLIRSSLDVERARRLVRRCAIEAGLGSSQAEELILATSELARNVVRHGGMEGTITCRRSESGRAVEVIVRDTGPGITDVARALEDGYSTSHGLGSGLPATRRLVDFFEIVSGIEGTTVRILKNVTLV